MTLRVLSPHELRGAAHEAEVAPVTFRRWLEGLPIRSTCRARIERVAAQRGLVPAPAGMNASELAPTGGMRL